MTARAGSYIGGLPTTYDSAHAMKAGAVQVLATVLGSNPPIYKNQGYYGAGAVYEEWISSPLPSTFPPSGHTLTDVQFVVLQSS